MIFFMINIKEVSQKDLVRADEISTARGICYFLFVLQEKAPVFSQSEVRNFFHVHYCLKNLPL